MPRACWSAASSLAALAAVVAAQAPPQVVAATPLAEAEWDAAGLELVVRDGGIAGVRWHRAPDAVDTIPLASPRERVAFARVGAGILVVLAGGVRDSLDVYVANAGGAIQRLASEGGRRLPATFAGGLGSFPVAVGDDVFVLAFQKDARCELRAFGFAGLGYASRSLPLTTEGFTVRCAADTRQVSVALLGVAEDDVRFLHPSAPRLRAARGLVDFGHVPPGGLVRTSLTIQNIGPVAVRAHVRAEGVGFTAPDAAWIDCAPGGEVGLALAFAPAATGPAQGVLWVGEGQLGEPLRVALRGEGVDAPPVAVAGPERAPDRVVALPAEVPTPAPPPAKEGTLPVPAAKDPIPPAPAVEAPPSLRARDGSVEVAGRPGETLLLASVAMDADRGRPLRPLGRWEVRLPASEGRLRLPVGRFGNPGDSLWLVALRVGRSGAVVESDVVPIQVPRD